MATDAHELQTPWKSNNLRAAERRLAAFEADQKSAELPALETSFGDKPAIHGKRAKY
jgi:hypothetical protein